MPQIIIGIIVIVLAVYAIGAIIATVGFIATNVILFIERAFFMSRIIPPIYSWGIIGLITGVSVAAYKEAPRYGKGGLQPLIVIIPVLIVLINGAYNHQNAPRDLARPATSRNFPQPPTRGPVPAPETPSINITKAVVSSGLDTNQVPVGIGTNFSSGNKRLYYYISYNGAIADRTVVTFKWYKNKYEIRESKFPLKYASGNVWNFFDYDFQPGQYEVQVYANGQQLDRTSFNVSGSNTDIQKEKIPVEPPALPYYPRVGQSEQQQRRDHYDCSNWAIKQTGYDPALPQVSAFQKKVDFRRALGACLEGRGYAVQRIGPPAERAQTIPTKPVIGQSEIMQRSINDEPKTKERFDKDIPLLQPE